MFIYRSCARHDEFRDFGMFGVIIFLVILYEACKEITGGSSKDFWK